MVGKAGGEDLVAEAMDALVAKAKALETEAVPALAALAALAV